MGFVFRRSTIVFLILNHSGYFAQHHLDLLVQTMSPVQFLASKFPGKNEQEYRGHLGNFQISGMTGYVYIFQRVKQFWLQERLQPIATLSGGQKSRVAFALLSLQKPHVLLLDEVCTLTSHWVSLLKLQTSLLIIWILRYWFYAYMNPLFLIIATGSWCSDSSAPIVERRRHHHISRRKIYHLCGQRGTLLSIMDQAR